MHKHQLSLNESIFDQQAAGRTIREFNHSAIVVNKLKELLE